ncbi:CbtB domain-containing protein [Hoyosella subflava]|uniref:Cobalt transporter subunit CbtB n=1 Tax=Hoyosella subflava (strain DSM 45089 / JCM 17490 / NBRC 109087 / DQS3-9A1) TaxID=443218 RepID=F6EGX7_HOYSD|nr:CbtB domain-containing protein [Hoyosella subflava]AEF38801.1 hypothetical protein AS9A_0342 [Hoyosella subflava DQS3-9A1]
MVTAHAPAQSAGNLSTHLLGVVVVSAAILVLYLTGFDQGAVSQTGMYLHELMHDGRHLMGVPCH